MLGPKASIVFGKESKETVIICMFIKKHTDLQDIELLL